MTEASVEPALTPDVISVTEEPLSVKYSLMSSRALLDRQGVHGVTKTQCRMSRCEQRAERNTYL